MRIRILAACVTSMIIGVSFSVVPSAGAAPLPPGPAIALPSLTTTSIVPGAGTGGPGSAALNSAVSSACNSGNPLGGQQWYTLPTGADWTDPVLYVRAIAHTQDLSHNGGMLSSTALAVVDYTDTNELLTCGSPDPDGIAAVTATFTPAQHAAVVIYWDPAELRGCRTEVDADCDFDPDAVEMFAEGSSTDATNIDPSSATTISALPYHAVEDGALGSNSDNPIGASTCVDGLVSPDDMGRLFWKYTATSTGDLPIGVDGPRFLPPDDTGIWEPWVGVADITGGSPGTDVNAEDGDCGSGRWFPVTSGHTYLIEVSHFNDQFWNLTSVPGGPVILDIAPIGTHVAPESLTATDDGSGGVTLDWLPPGGYPYPADLEDYLITRDGVDTHGNGPQTGETPEYGSEFNWPDLVTGDTYTFTVTALSDDPGGGTGMVAGVPARVVFTVGVPSAPTSVTASANTSAHSATLNWQPPTTLYGHPVTGYRVSRTGNDTANTGPFSTVLPYTARSETFTKMLPGSNYILSVRAITAGGTGPAATASVYFPGPPDEPSDVSTTFNAAAKTGTLHWSPPLNDGGSAITGYRVSRDGTDTAGVGAFAATVASTARSYTFSHLNAWETYTLTVQAINALGTGLGNPAMVFFTATTPGPPGGVTATRGNHTAKVVWTTPTQTGGSPITSYRIRRFAGTSTTVQETATVSATVHSFTAGGLTNGSSYSFDVTASNSHGLGANSTRSNAVTPATVPNAPVIGSASAGTAGAPITATARWSAPSVTGGSPITGYKVTALRMSSTGTVLATTVSSVLGSTLRSYVMTLPVAGNYRFTVQAINAVGGSAQSARSNLVAGQ